MQEVKLTKGYVTLIDDEDLERVCRLYLGTYINPLEAACAYDRSAVEHFGEFAHCNFARTD